MTKEDRLLMQETKKVWNVGYNDSHRDRDLDRMTNFIFHIQTFSELMDMLLVRFPEWNNNRNFYVDYAISRWYKYQSAKFAESVFNSFPNVRKATIEEDNNHIDFFIENVPFDLKNVIYPRTYGVDYEEAKTHPVQLAKWLMQHRGARWMQEKKYWHNQLYLVFRSSIRPHWMLKAEFPKIERAITRWMKLGHQTFEPIWGHGALAGVIWVTE